MTEKANRHGSEGVNAAYLLFLHEAVEVNDVLHPVEEPVVYLGETVESVYSVASLQGCSQHKHPLVCGVHQFLCRRGKHRACIGHNTTVFSKFNFGHKANNVCSSLQGLKE